MNSQTGGPDLAQIVTIRDISEQARIAHLVLTDLARVIVGHELVFTAIHKAARHGIHRLCSPHDPGLTSFGREVDVWHAQGTGLYQG